MNIFIARQVTKAEAFFFYPLGFTYGAIRYDYCLTFYWCDLSQYAVLCVYPIARKEENDGKLHNCCRILLQEKYCYKRKNSK